MEGQRDLSVHDVAERLNVSERTIRRLIGQGRLAAYWAGGILRVTAKDVDSFIEANRVKPNAPEEPAGAAAGKKATAKKAKGKG